LINILLTKYRRLRTKQKNLGKNVPRLRNNKLYLFITILLDGLTEYLGKGFGKSAGITPSQINRGGLAKDEKIEASR